jgi:hypothetical protein
VERIGKMKIEKRTSFVNTDTGEILNSKNQFIDLHFDDEDGYLFWYKKNHIKTFVEIPLPDCFGWADEGRISRLKHYMLNDSQLLVYRGNKAIKPLTKLELSRIWQLNIKRCAALISKMKKHGIVKEVKVDGNVYFAYNPMYGLKAKRISLTMFLWFQEELTAVFPDWVTKKFLEQANDLKPDIQIIK